MKIHILLGKNQYRKAFLESGVASAQALLRQARRERVIPQCLCHGNKTVPMHIKQRNDHYSLCRNPGSGQQHHLMCSSYDERTPLSGRSNFSESAIKTRDDGSLFIRPAFNLSLKKHKANKANEEKPLKQSTSGDGKAYNRVGLLGFLHALYEKSGFHRWSPRMKGKRNHACFVKYLSIALEQSQFSNGNNVLSYCCLPRAGLNVKAQVLMRALPAPTRNRQKTCKTAPRQVILIGRLEAVYPTTHGYAMKLTCGRDCPLYLSDTQWKNLCRSYLKIAPQEKAQHFDTPSHLHLIIALARVSKNSHVVIIDEVASMPVTPDFIPFDSSYEKTVANALVTNDRSFIKPLRYEATQVTFPDFILTDTTEPVPMEVYGMTNNAAYDKRKQQKNCYYQKAFRQFWQWDIGKTTEMPAFPPKKSLYY